MYESQGLDNLASTDAMAVEERGIFDQINGLEETLEYLTNHIDLLTQKISPILKIEDLAEGGEPGEKLASVDTRSDLAKRLDQINGRLRTQSNLLVEIKNRVNL